MNFTENLITLAQAQETSLFPFPFTTHLIFVCISAAFLIFQFIREKKPYQIIITAGIVLSMAIWLSENRTLFYAIGIAEALLLLGAFVTAVVFKHKELEEAAGDNQNTADRNENDREAEAQSAEENTAGTSAEENIISDGE